ncbi:MAG: DinB family protein [Chloroflexota bacterium]|nr:DinB family protein [Chloroflexota bacterium]
MATATDRVTRVLTRLDAAWVEFQEAYAGLSDERLLESGVTGEWSVRDLIAHVTWWEEEALKHLPLILDGGRAPRYSVTYGGIDAFNALMTERRRNLSLAEVRGQFEATHRRLVAYIRRVPPEQLAGETRFRRRLRLDTYGHYPIHTRQIRDWRRQRGAG